jgi:hypothetical protein
MVSSRGRPHAFRQRAETGWFWQSFHRERKCFVSVVAHAASVRGFWLGFESGICGGPAKSRRSGVANRLPKLSKARGAGVFQKSSRYERQQSTDQNHVGEGRSGSARLFQKLDVLERRHFASGIAPASDGTLPRTPSRDAVNARSTEWRLVQVISTVLIPGTTFIGSNPQSPTSASRLGASLSTRAFIQWQR